MLWVGDITTWVKIQEVVLIIFGLQAVYILLNFRKENINTFLTVEGLIFLFISSDFFPWAFLEKRFPIINNYFQFPNRLSAIFFPLLYVGFGMTITKLTKTAGFQVGALMKCLLAFVILFTLRADLRENIRWATKSQSDVVLSQQLRDHNLGNFIQTNHLDNPDYLPLKKHLNAWEVAALTRQYFNGDDGSYQKQVLSGGRLKISWKSDKNQEKLLPIVMYKQSELALNGKKVKPKINEIGMPEVSEKVGNNSAILSFKTPLSFKGLFIITILSWLLLIAYGCKYGIGLLKSHRK